MFITKQSQTTEQKSKQTIPLLKIHSKHKLDIKNLKLLNINQIQKIIQNHTEKRDIYIPSLLNDMPDKQKISVKHEAF